MNPRQPDRADRYHAGAEPPSGREFSPKQKEPHWGRRTLARDRHRVHLRHTSKQVGDAGHLADHLKVFASVDAAETWFEENDREGVAFEYEVLQ
jgi:hypothetical protein